MNILNALILVMVVVILTLYARGVPEQTTEQILNNMSSVEHFGDNITSQYAYQSMYDGNITTTKVINNVVNAFIYPLIIGINTIIPLTIYATKGGIWQVYKSIIILACVYFLIRLIIWLIKNSIIIYFFIKEKKRDKTKVYE